MKKIIVSILIVLILIAGLFVLTGCGNNTNSNDSSENVTSNMENEITTTISCYNEGYLFKSKKYVEHVFYLNKDNKLIKRRLFLFLLVHLEIFWIEFLRAM